MAQNTGSIVDFTQTPCADCGEISTTNERMVACDGCESWYHIRCVGLSAETKLDDKWFCTTEACKVLAQKYEEAKGAKKKSRSKRNADDSDRSSVKSDRVISVDQRIREIEENQKRMEKEMEAELMLKKKEREIKRALERKRLLLEQQMREEEEEEEMALQEQILRERMKQVERMKSRQQSFQNKMADLDKQLETLKVPVGNKSKAKVNPGEGGLKPKTTPSRLEQEKSLGTPKLGKLTEKNLQKLNNLVQDGFDEDEEDDHEDGEEELDEGDHVPEDKGDSKVDPNEKVDRTSQPGLGQQHTGPTKAQLAARSGITKKLPTFSGKPEEWPLFYGMYQASNEACGFTDVENLVRLQECLKGPALEMVRGQLLLPKSVPKVIEKLRTLYGRPEQLLQSHLEKVRRLEPPKAGKLASFIPFGTAVEQLCEHLEAAKLEDHLINPLLIQDLVDKLPDSDKREWVRYKRSKNRVTLRTFTDFISEIVSEACEANVSLDYKPVSKSITEVRPGKGKAKEKGALYNHSEGESVSTGTEERKKQKPCRVCQRTDHRLRYCQDFKNLSYADRMKVVDRYKLCQVCLNEHGTAPCKFKLRCNVGECRESHNPLLHPVLAVVGTSAHIRSNNVTLFRMIPVNLHCGERSITVLAFLDEGASVTLVEKSLVDRLGVIGVQEKLTIKWTADITREEKESRRMNLWASAVDAEEKLLLKTVRTVDKLMLPQQSLNAEELSKQYAHMRGLSISSYNGRPEMLIGLNNIHSFAPIEAKIGTVVDPIAVRCKFGWTVYGPKQANADEAGGAYLGYHHEVSNEDLHDLLKTHYALEESVVSVPRESAEDQRAREILQQTTKRIGDRFETGLLWKTDDPRFPDSYPLALKRLKQLEKKLEKNPGLRENVCRQIDEYQEKGYAHLATEEELVGTEPGKVWYLPLNVVLNPKKPGKVRLIWDAAASVQGVSLNSQLLKGPDLLVPLVVVLVGFRERRIAIGGDLREMFHQMMMIVNDKRFQRFLFRKNPQDPPSIFVMDVATFGSTSSPCSAQFVKNLNAQEYAGQYPEAAAAIINRHYVDDYFDSVDTVEEAIERAKQVKFIHQRGGFEIRNWVSNSSDVLQSLGEQNLVPSVHFTQDKATMQERVLGIIWNPERDEFSFSTQHREELLPYLCGDKRPTKRIVLSCVMGFFDPLGLLSPFTIHGKIIIQHLWRSGCDWDEAIDNSCWEMWKRWIGLLAEVEEVRIPRCYLGDVISSDVESIELHIFTDASEHAYGCVAYLRVVIGGVVKCSLAMSRAKVAPLKRQSIPRLELMAAVLGARLSQTIMTTHTLKIDRCVLWTDSRTVCSWIRSDQHQFKQFVAFRIGEILELTRSTDWRWIPTKLNMADVLTKWGRSPFLQSDSEWFTGAAFLYEPEDKWPSIDTPIAETQEEARGVVLFHEVVAEERCSRWTTLLRATAFAVRFIENCKRKKKGLPIITTKATEKQQQLIKVHRRSNQQPIDQDEFRKAETILWQQAQFDGFPDEMSALTKNFELKPGQEPERIAKSSSIFKLTPVIDEDGVLRVGGRMETSTDMSFDKKFPIVLPRKHGLTGKLIQQYHEKFGHANRETVVNELRQRFWIPNIRAAVLQVMRQCVWCKVHRCRPLAPMMAPLPVQRVTPYLRPFSSVGVDYLGPIEVIVGRRKEKRWVAVFTCLAIRAVHLEVVHSLTTQSCLMAIRRFSKEHGVPAEIFSDNGTCFKGAANEMRRIDSECAENVASASTAWHFNPPATPHMGGIWERMVRSVKECMKALDDGRTLTDEVLLTVLAEAADMINSRPLTYVPQESAQEEAITPNHFLRGTVTIADLKVDGSISPAEALRDAYKRSQDLANRMWDRWSKEYLPTINKRTKWFEDQKPLEVNDLVFVVDGKNRKCWTRGIVEEVIPGPDGRIRQANIRTAGGVYRRAVANLAVLEFELHEKLIAATETCFEFSSEQKAYVAVYVCMATKAIHLEAVSDLTTNAFLASLKRFVSRRGLVQRLYYDNATNFKGAHNELNELFIQFQNQQTVQEIRQFCQTREIEWHFIPPDAPEFGGLWESAVKSAKTHLKRIVGNSKLTFEELATVLAEIEAVLNSRPLFAISNDPADADVITPAHYLIGRPLIAPAEPSLENLNANRLNRWQHLQLMRDHFWKAWSRDYLNTLQPRKKYLRTTPNIRVGMIVLLHEKTQPPLSWKLGRISAVYPGADDLVRVVDVFSDGSMYRRSITKISILPIEDNQDNVPESETGEKC